MTFDMTCLQNDIKDTLLLVVTKTCEVNRQGQRILIISILFMYKLDVSLNRVSILFVYCGLTPQSTFFQMLGWSLRFLGPELQSTL